MKRFNRTLAGLLSIIYIFSSVPMGVMAQEDIGISAIEAEEVVSANEIISVNGIFDEMEYHVLDDYEDIYTPEDIREYIESNYSESDYQTAEDEVTLQEVISSTSEATALLKERMLKRTDVIIFNATERIDIEQAMKAVFVENAANGPKEGGYLRSNTIGYASTGSSSGGEWTYTITMTYTANAEQEKQVDDKIDEIVARYNLRSDSLSQSEKIRIIHDYLLDTITYKSDGTYGSHGAYSALIKGYCVCQGYSAACYRLCKEAGIDSRYITSKEIGHAWNLVQISDLGNGAWWYNMDVTWDDGNDRVPIYDYYMKNDVDFKGHPRDAEFLTKSYIENHPIAYYSLGQTSVGYDSDNPEFEFTSIDGKKMTSVVNEADGVPKILIFYNTGSSDAIEIIKKFSDSIPAKYGCVDIYAIEVSKASVAKVQGDKKAVGNAETVTFSADSGNVNLAAADAYRKATGLSIYMPQVYMIDEHNRLRIAQSFNDNDNKPAYPQDLDTVYMRYLVDDWKAFGSPLNSISFSKSSLRIGIKQDYKESRKLVVNYTPDNCVTPKRFIYSSSDENIATVDSIGIVTAQGIGEATITAMCAGKKATCTVRVVRMVDAVDITDSYGNVIDNQTIDVYAGQTIELNAVTNPIEAVIIGKITWTTEEGIALGINSNDRNNTIYVTPSEDIVEVTNTRIKLEIDGAESECTLRIIPSKIKFDANGGTIGGETVVYEKIGVGTAFGKLPVVDDRDGYMFVGWNTSINPVNGEYVTENTIFTEQRELYAIWHTTEAEKMWARDPGSYTYTGAAIKPGITVYNGKILLKEGVDYTVVYKNNKNVYEYKEGDPEFKENKAPCAVIVGKGNYDSQVNVYFTITRKSINSSSITINTDQLYKSANGKQQKLIPTIKFGKNTLKNNVDYKLTYIDEEKEGAYREPGTYRVSVEGLCNYKGSRIVNIHIADKKVINITKTSVRNVKNYEYDGSHREQVLTGDNRLMVLYGKTELVNGEDYYIVYSNNVEIGTATMKLVGIGEYTGVKTVKYKITGKNISKAVIDKDCLKAVTYKGMAIEPQIVLKYKIDRNTETTLTRSTDGGRTGDYVVSYSNNINAGTAKVIITGINGYTGKITKTFKIKAYELPLDRSRVRIENSGSLTATYCKSGARPDIRVSYAKENSDGGYDWVLLTEGIDYSLKYVRNNSVYGLRMGDEGFYTRKDKTNSPMVVITGKGNYSGALSEYYTITTATLKEQSCINVSDVTYADKPGKWKSRISVTDYAGKKLTAGKDYDKSVTYTYYSAATMTDGTVREAGMVVAESDIPVAGTVIKVTITGMGNYSNNPLDVAYTTYRIIPENKNIAKGIIFKIADKTYIASMNPDTGITITKDDIIVIPDKNHTDFTADDYEIVEGSYTRNRFTGTASVLLRGKNEYGGVKRVNFKIRKKHIR